MLLLHQSGSVKVGEVARYTLTYTPSLDRILPPPQHLHVKIKNTSAIPLRAAYLHGPYTLYVSSYPSTFDPNVKQERVKEEGSPDYEPQLKAGGSWTSKLTVPETIRQSAQDGARTKDGERKSFTWIIEIASQVLFSTTAAVHYELLVGRDEKSVALGITGAVSVGSGQGLPGKLEDLQNKRQALKTEVQTRGVFSKAVRLAVDDTESLWNTPEFPSWDSQGSVNIKQTPEHGDKRDTEAKQDEKQRKQKKIHLVLLTHGLHSNLGADMLYMKETIDSAAKQAREESRQRKAELRAKKVREDNEFGRSAAKLRSESTPEVVVAPTPSLKNDEDDEDEEQVIVRGFNGNAIKTEKGIQYLGKRLAKYVLSITYPDQPFLPVKSSISRSITRSLTGLKSSDTEGVHPTHKNSTIIKDEQHTNNNLAYKITSISFIGHSLGGLVQTYAVAYIQKHSPEFFDRITPINFIALASPFLGLSNENPTYVKFALDFGLVGRTGQDLGLTWRAPTIARSGWGAVVNGLVNDPHKDHQPDPRAKPLLRILPTGPAHQALKQFRNRTVYSNVVNDGIVPLRTSCLLFLDWRGLDRVEKARRANGLIGTMVNWGWNEMTGQNATTAAEVAATAAANSSNRKPLTWNDFFSDDTDDNSKDADDRGSTVPDARASQFLDVPERDSTSDEDSVKKSKQARLDNTNAAKEDSKQQESNTWTGFLSWFKPQAASKPADSESIASKQSKTKAKKVSKIYQRGQIMSSDESEPPSPERSSVDDSQFSKSHGHVRGSSLYTNNSMDEGMAAPPKTTVFESAGDLLSPPLPPKEFLLDPAARPRTIFHDRVYHPEDIPPPPSKRQRTFMRFNGGRGGSQNTAVPNQAHEDMNKISSSKPESSDNGTMKIEEKIARAYHKDMSWRKVLVSMEPDAHNNLIVRRMFANAYGWPVVKHLCDTHFAFTATAQTKDDDEDTNERAKPQSEAVGSTGEQVRGQVDPPDDESLLQSPKQSAAEIRSRSVDLGSSSNLKPHGTPRVSRHSVQSVSDLIRSREKLHENKGRSPSEVRESRDEVPDLIGMTSVTATGVTTGSFSESSHSGTAALHRLARQDSGRWSDRFFEGSDNDSDDDEAYFARLRQERVAQDIARSNASSRASTHRETTMKLPFGQVTSGKQSPIRVMPERLITDTQGLVDEPDMLTPASRQGSVVGKPEIDTKTSNLSHVGLGKTSSEQILGVAEDGEQSGRVISPSITEQVAHASARSDIDKDEKGVKK